MVPKGRFELPRPDGHYALNVARLPFRHFGIEGHSDSFQALLQEEATCSGFTSVAYVLCNIRQPKQA